MEFRYTIRTHEQLVRLQCWGAVTPERLVATMRRIGADPDYRPHFAVLADFREAQGEWDYSEVQRLRDYLVRAGRGGSGVRWIALIASGTLAAAVHLAIVITDAIESGIRMRLFEDPTAALDWLRSNQVMGERACPEM